MRGRNVDLAAFKATYDIEYEDAVEKLGRAKADPAVAAVLGQVPEEELVAIILYMSTHYVEMNRTLRERDKESLADVGDAIALADRGLEKLPSFQGWCSRGVDGSAGRRRCRDPADPVGIGAPTRAMKPRGTATGSAARHRRPTAHGDGSRRTSARWRGSHAVLNQDDRYHIEERLGRALTDEDLAGGRNV